MATLKDVAQLANVSVTTASYALNNRPETKPETKKKVLKAAVELNYVANGTARDLRRGESRICALVLSNLTGPYFSELIRGVEDESYEAGYDLIVATTNQIYRGSSFRIMDENRADGFLVFSQFVEESLIRRVGARSPIILIDRESSFDGISSVTIDNRGGAEEATRYLVEKGHENIMFLGGSDASFNNQDRLAGFNRILAEHGLHPFDVVNADFSERKAFEIMYRLLNGARVPDAVFGANDQMVLGVYDAAMKSGIRIPDDLSVVGFDDASFTRFLSPSLTTVRQPGYLQGRNAASKLFGLLDGREEPCNDEPLPTELVERDSVIPAGKRTV